MGMLNEYSKMQYWNFKVKIFLEKDYLDDS